MSQITIYSAYFAPAQQIHSDIIRPIQVGAARAKTRMEMLHDDDGEDNISDRNPAYCEASGIYWAWKHDTTSDAIGFFHYRRLLSFRPDLDGPLDMHGLLHHPVIDNRLMDRFGLDPQTIALQVASAELLVPVPFDVRDSGAPSLRNQYERADHHHIEDLDRAERIVAEIALEYSAALTQALDGPLLYPNNIFVFHREVFEDYCNFLFPVLARLDAEIDTSGYNWQECRAVGYIAERLFTAFILAQPQLHPERRIKHLNRVLIDSTSPDPVEPPLPVTDLPVLTLVASTDAAYLPHMGALIASVFRNTRPDVFIDFLVLHDGLAAGPERLLKRMVRLRPDAARISFIDMQHQFAALKTNSYFARATFYRLGLPALLKSRRRIVFLDTDMVVLDDLTTLADIDLGEQAIAAAAPDLVMRSFVGLEVAPLDHLGGETAQDYLDNHLGMPEGGRGYFQAGLLVIDLDRLREAQLVDRMVADLEDGHFWFLDQDVLNKHLAGRTVPLPARWNVLWMDDAHASALSVEDQLIYNDAMRDPAVVHFAGLGKPWRNHLNPMSHYYWEYLRDTPWYENVLFGFLDPRYRPPHQPARPGRLRTAAFNGAARVWWTLPRPVKARIWPFANRIKRMLQ